MRKLLPFFLATTLAPSLSGCVSDDGFANRSDEPWSSPHCQLAVGQRDGDRSGIATMQARECGRDPSMQLPLPGGKGKP